MHEGMSIYGVRFLPLVDRIANAQREQKLWRFLVAVQRNAKQERTPTPVPRTFHDWKLRPPSRSGHPARRNPAADERVTPVF